MAVLKLLQVFLKIATKFFVTFVAGSSESKRDDVAKILTLGASLGQNYKLLEPLKDDHKADLEQVDIANI